MRLIRWMAALAAMPAFSASIFITPFPPTTNDTVVLQVTGDQPCASIIPGTVEMASNTIRVRYETGETVLCTQPLPQPQRIAIGRFPAGQYNIELVKAQGDVVIAVAVFNVSNPPASGDRGPLDDHSGHYTSTDGPNEGVFVTQFGRMAFISYLSYAADGKPEWHVVSDARWDPATNSFSGGLMRVESGPSGTGTGILTSFQYVGQARFTPTSNFDQARFDATLLQRAVTRNLTRYRF